MERSPFSNFIHIGVVVRDMDKAIEYYQSLSIGPFEPMKGAVLAERRIMGKVVDPDSVKVKTRSADMGGIQIELLEPGEGKSTWRKFLETKGEGIHHVGSLVNGIDEETAKLEAQVITCFRIAKLKGSGGGL